MLVPVSWLEEFTGFKVDPENLRKKMTMAGVEVESLKEMPNGDVVLNLGLTPNRGDCLSILGVAAEASAVLGRSFAAPRVKIPKGRGKIKDYLAVEVLDIERCPRYTARVISGVKVGPSPEWLRERLEACGIRSVNNIVDATNYVMLEYGQPLHAFDYRDIRGWKIIVRCLNTSYKFVTLDGVERELTGEDLMICDAEGPIAIGGVMGGANSEVKNDTTIVVLESAYFNPVSIRKTSSRLGLFSESSRRFEKGVDPNGVDRALHRLTGLITDIAGGTPTEDWIDKYKKKIRPRRIYLSTDDVNFLLGTKLDYKKIAFYLKNLGMAVSRRKGKIFSVLVPTRRPDIERPVDLIEEVARLHGYDKVPETMPKITVSSPLIPENEGVENSIKAAFVGLGFYEVINYGFCSLGELDLFKRPSDEPVVISNPLTVDCEVMKTTLLPGLILNARRALNFGEPGLKIFELRPVFQKKVLQWPVVEKKKLAGLVYGARSGISWFGKEEEVDFFDIKGACEAVLASVGLEAEFRKCEDNSLGFLHPHISSDVYAGKRCIGFAGRLSPDLQRKFGFERPVFCFELDFDTIADLSRGRKFVFEEMSRFPTVRRDIAILVDEGLPSSRPLEEISRLKHPLIKKVKIFDVYKGEGIPKGKKSLAFALFYGAPDRTLSDIEIKDVHGMVAQRLKSELGAEVR